MELHQLPKTIQKKKQRVGRGNASNGTYCGRGCKGLGQRKSGNVRPGFEGGQTPLYMRLPKLKGFKSPSKVEYQVVNVSQLENLKAGDKVTGELLESKGLISHATGPIKILGTGELTKKLVIAPGITVSKIAKEKIQKASGTFE